MRRMMALMMALALAMGGAALAEDAMAELRDIRRSVEDGIAEIHAPEVTPAPEAEPTPSPTPDMTVYTPLTAGAKGDAVTRLQQKLRALGLLEGSADGIYGAKTADAVKRFQQSEGLEPTGEADAETQRALFAAQTASLTPYAALNYAQLVPGGAQYSEAPVTFRGVVMQALTDDTYADEAGVYTVLRVATRGSCYDVVYVSLFRPADAEPFREGDAVSVRGITKGLVYFTSVGGKYISLPRIAAESVTAEP